MSIVNKEVMAIVAIVAIILTSGVGLSLIQSSDGEDFQIISRVNTGGSGIYIKNDTKELLTPQGKLLLGGLIMGTPGVSSIQHIQLQQLAERSELKFKAYTEGERLSDDTLYYIPDLNTFSMIESNTKIDGGIIWEPQYQRVIQELCSKYSGLVLTNDIFGDHTCCVVVANQSWLNDNKDAAVKFLKGYIEGVKFVNDEMNHDELIKIAKELTKIEEKSILEKAVKNVKYKFDDDGKGDLSKLLEDNLKFSSKLRDAGHISDDKLLSVKKFVNDSIVKEALEKNENNTDDVKVKVPISVIDGDIHQIAVYVSYKKGYFEHHGLEVDFKRCSSGVKVAEMLLSGDVKIGFLGAPPAIIKLA